MVKLTVSINSRKDVVRIDITHGKEVIFTSYKLNSKIAQFVEIQIPYKAVRRLVNKLIRIKDLIHSSNGFIPIYKMRQFRQYKIGIKRYTYISWSGEYVYLLANNQVKKIHTSKLPNYVQELS